MTVSKDQTPHTVLYVPNLDYNLLFVSQLTQNHQCVAKFYLDFCEFQNLSSWRTTGNAKAHAGLFLIEVDTTCITSSHCPKNKLISPKDDPIMLWHYHLGHPNFLYLHRMFPSLFQNKSQHSFIAKCVNYQNIFVILFLVSHIIPRPFSMIHSDI